MRQRTGTPQLTTAQPTAPRKLASGDAAALARFAPTIAAPDDSGKRAVFAIENAWGMVGAMELSHTGRRVNVEQLVLAPGHESQRPRMIELAEFAARELGARDVVLRAGVLADETAAELGYRNGIKVAEETPLWRDGSASLGRTVYFRGVWAAIALIVGFGATPAAVHATGGTTWVHIVAPAVLAAIGTLFAAWQLGLIVRAGWRLRRRDGRLAFTATCGATAAAAAFIVLMLHDHTVPALAELWNIYTGDRELGALDITLADDGRRMLVEGAYGLRSDEEVRRALERHPAVREVVLAGPGGRVAVGMELFKLFRARKLATRVETICASACTFAFLGGTERSISDRGRLGFHRASFPGMGDDDMYDSNRSLRRFLIFAGRVTPEFADKVFATAPDRLWVPTKRELLDGHVVDRVGP